MNRLKALILLATLTALVVWAGQLVGGTTGSREVSLSAGTPATAHLFIVNPFTGGGLLRLFSTHPPTEARVARLLAMEHEGLAMVR